MPTTTLSEGEQLHAEIACLRTINANLLAALPDPDKLEILAKWLDLDDVVLRRGATSQPMVQDDLREWATRTRAAIKRAGQKGT